MAVATAVVFVVDDDPSVRKSLTRVIAAAGDAVETFVSAREFQERAPVTGPCCLVLDVRMPGVTAMELPKPFASRDLLGAIQRAVERDTRNLGTEARTEEIQARVKTLTPRERQVFTLVVAGMLNKQIAAELGVVEKTVKVHRARVMDKMRAGSVAELVRLAADVGVIVTRA